MSVSISLSTLLPHFLTGPEASNLTGPEASNTMKVALSLLLLVGVIRCSETNTTMQTRPRYEDVTMDPEILEEIFPEDLVSLNTTTLKTTTKHIRKLQTSGNGRDLEHGEIIATDESNKKDGTDVTDGTDKKNSKVATKSESDKLCANFIFLLTVYFFTNTGAPKYRSI